MPPPELHSLDSAAMNRLVPKGPQGVQRVESSLAPSGLFGQPAHRVGSSECRRLRAYQLQQGVPSPAERAICWSYPLGQVEAHTATMFCAARSLFAMGQHVTPASSDPAVR
jgi:hypothetical protein